MDGTLILTGLIIATGCGLFLRLVAKETQRRERYLQLRLAEKLKEQEAREKTEADTAEHPPEDTEPVATAQPLDTSLQTVR